MTVRASSGVQSIRRASQGFHTLLDDIAPLEHAVQSKVHAELGCLAIDRNMRSVALT
jgi:hypothetical protein